VAAEVRRLAAATFEVHGLPVLELRYSPVYAPARNDARIVDLLRRQAGFQGGEPSASP